MRVIDKVTRVNRRDVLRVTAGAATVAAIAPTVGRTALAEPLKTVNASGAETLLKMARDIYPHDRIPDVFYQNAIASIDKEVSEGGSKTLLSDGVAELDAAATKIKGKPYAALTAENDRVEVLKSMEAGAFFQKVRSSLVTALYNQPDLWIKMGYEGPSYDKGGYINRGFNDIDWL